MDAPRGRDRRLTNFARAMRKKPTDAEAKLWSVLRFRQLDGHRFRRQRPVAGYIVDFYCPSRRLAIELDGGQHADEAQAEYDRIRTERLNEAGIRVVRYSDHDVLRDTDWVVEEILRQLEKVWPPPQPSPGVPGEGE
jgi:very-short-patch-repair endonuclease